MAIPVWEGIGMEGAEGRAESLWLPLNHPAQQGPADRTAVLYALHWPQRKWCLSPREQPQLDSLRRASKELRFQHVSHGQSFFSFFLFLAHLTDLEFNLQTLPDSQL